MTDPRKPPCFDHPECKYGDHDKCTRCNGCLACATKRKLGADIREWAESHPEASGSVE